MPNWCDGNIRVRGTYDRIVKFFKETLVALKADEKGEIVEVPIKVIKDGDFHTVLCKPDKLNIQEFWFQGSKRQFLKRKSVHLTDYSDEDFQEIVICVHGFHGAWGIDLDAFETYAKKYGVDIKIVGYERGMEFVEWAEFLRDGQVKEKTERFDDWDWDCPWPNLGG